MSSALFVAESWRAFGPCGVSLNAVNYSLAKSYMSEVGGRVHCVVASFDQTHRQDAEKCGVNLITPSLHPEIIGDKIVQLLQNPCRSLDKLLAPGLFYKLREETYSDQYPAVRHVIGHYPLTSQGALTIKYDYFPDADYVLLLHALPDDVSMTPSKIYIEEQKLLSQVKSAKMIFSVGNRVYEYCDQKFGQVLEKGVHHLYLPGPDKTLFDTEIKPPEVHSQKSVLSYDSFVKDKQYHNYETLADGLSRVCDVCKEAEMPVPDWMIHVENPENYTDVESIVQSQVKSIHAKINIRETFHSIEKLSRGIEESTVGLYPCEEPHGMLALGAMSAGLPFVVSDDSSSGRFIMRQFPEFQDFFVVKMSRTKEGKNTDAENLKKKLISILNNPNLAFERASALKKSFFENQEIKESHSQFYNYCKDSLNRKSGDKNQNLQENIDSDQVLPNETDDVAIEGKALVKKQSPGLDADPQDIVQSLTNLGNVLGNKGHYSEAIECFRKSLAMGERLYGHDTDRQEITWSLNNLGIVLHKKGQYSEAIECHQKALVMRQRLYGQDTDHQDIAQSLTNLGNVLGYKDQDNEAIECHQKALAMRQRLYGQDSNNQDIVWSLNNLGIALRNKGQYSEAIECHRKALAMKERLHGQDADHQDIAWSLNNLGMALCNKGRYSEAIECHQKALAMKERLHGQDADHQGIAQSFTNLGIAFCNQGQYSEAIKYHQKALALMETLYGQDADHQHIALSFNSLGMALHGKGQYSEAFYYHQKALAMRERLYGQDTSHPDIAQSLNNLGLALYCKGQYTGAIDCHQKALVMRQRLCGQDTDHQNIVLSLTNLGNALDKKGQNSKAIECHRKAMAMWQRLQSKSSGNRSDQVDSRCIVA